MLTFDEFLSISPCTTGKHLTADETPVAAPPKYKNLPPPAPVKPVEVDAVTPAFSSGSAVTTASQSASRSAQNAPPAPPEPPESDSDDLALSPNLNTPCKRRGCDATYSNSSAEARERGSETCTYHPGQALFHEGSKGWTCCKKRVLEFDEFMRIPGCKTRTRHCFIGKKASKSKSRGDEDEWTRVDTVRHDFYQTGALVHASLYLKKIDKNKSVVWFAPDGSEISLDLKTGDSKRYQTKIPLFAQIDPGKSSFRVLGTKLELTLVKSDGASWPVLRADERHTGEIIQTGRPDRT